MVHNVDKHSWYNQKPGIWIQEKIQQKTLKCENIH